VILDAFAVVAFLRDEPAAGDVERLLVRRSAARLTSVGVAEVLDQLIRISGADEENASLDLAQLGLADPEPLEPSVAAAAGRLRARHYHRKRCAVSLVDCIAAESARSADVALATSDPHLLDVCHAEGIATEVLPDSTGLTWEPPSP